MDWSIEALVLSSPAVTIIVALAVAGFIIILIPVIMQVVDLAPYMYTNAKIRALEAGLLKKQKLEDLKNVRTRMDCISSLEETDYGAYLTKMEQPDSGEEMEQLLNKHTAEIYEKVKRSVPEEISPVIKDLMKIYDVKNIKMVFRAIRNEVPVEERTEFILPIGLLKKSIIKTLVESKTIEEAVSELESTEYGPIISGAMPKVEETGSLLPLELAIDKHVYEKTFRKVALSKSKNMVAVNILLGTKIDILNLKTLFRLNATGKRPDDIEDFIIRASHKFSDEKLKALAKTETIEELLSQLEGTPYADVLSEVVTSFKDTNSLYQIEKRLDDYFERTAKQVSINYGLGAGPALYLLSGKEADIRKIRMIAEFGCSGINIETGGVAR
ncbi:MAG: ATP synthase A1 subunit C [archaeon]